MHSLLLQMGLHTQINGEITFFLASLYMFLLPDTLPDSWFRIVVLICLLGKKPMAIFNFYILFI